MVNNVIQFLCEVWGYHSHVEVPELLGRYSVSTDLLHLTTFRGNVDKYLPDNKT